MISNAHAFATSMEVENYNESYMPNEVSIFVPHIGVEFTYEDIVHQFENVFELGKVDRIEAIPKVNQVDGHPYLACFLYFWKWGNGYNSQMTYNNMRRNTPTRMYVTPTLYWQVFKNTSEVANLPLPKHMSFHMLCHPQAIPRPAFLIDVFDRMNIGKVNPDSIYISNNCISLTMDYWYHSKTTYDLQELLHESKNTYLHVLPDVDYKETPKVVYTAEELLDDIESWQGEMFWTLIYDEVEPYTTGANPYIWNAREPDHPMNLPHPTRFD